jgi:hypothetical protein
LPQLIFLELLEGLASGDLCGTAIITVNVDIRDYVYLYRTLRGVLLKGTPRDTLGRVNPDIPSAHHHGCLPLVPIMWGLLDQEDTRVVDHHMCLLSAANGPAGLPFLLGQVMGQLGYDPWIVDVINNIRPVSLILRVALRLEA